MTGLDRLKNLRRRYAEMIENQHMTRRNEARAFQIWNIAVLVLVFGTCGIVGAVLAHIVRAVVK